MLKQSESLRPADGHLLFLHFLQLVHAVADVHPAASARVLDDRIGRVLFGCHFVDGLPVAFNNFAGVAGPHSSREHGSVCADGDVANWEEVVLGVIVGVYVDFSGSDEDKRRVDVDGELDVAVLVTVELELGLFLCGLIEGFVLLFLVLHLLLYYFINLT